MPQLDQFTYLTQFVWLCVCFMSFYVLLYNDALPKVSRILKLRSLLNAPQNTDAVASNQPVHHDEVITQALKNSVAYLVESASTAGQWCNEMVTSVNATQGQAMNKAYVRSLAEMSVSHTVHSHALDRLSALSPVVSKTSKNLFCIYVLRSAKYSGVMHVKTAPKGSRKKKAQNA